MEKVLEFWNSGDDENRKWSKTVYFKMDFFPEIIETNVGWKKKY